MATARSRDRARWRARGCWRCCGWCTGCRWACRRRSAAAWAGCCTRWPRSRRHVARRNVELCLPRTGRSRARCAGARALPLARPQPARTAAAVVREPRAAAPADPCRRRRQAGRTQRAAGDVAGAALHGAGRGRHGDAAVPDATRSARSTRSRATRSSTLRCAPGACASARATSSRAATPRCRWCARSAAASRSSTCPTWISASRMPPSCPSSACRRRRCWRRRSWRVRWTWSCSRCWPRLLPRRPGLPRALPAAVDRLAQRRRRWPTPLRMNRWIEDADPRQPGAVPVGAQALQDAARRASRACMTESARLGGTHNRRMKLPFTKMQGAGNDFVVLDASAGRRWS